MPGMPSASMHVEAARPNGEVDECDGLEESVSWVSLGLAGQGKTFSTSLFSDQSRYAMFQSLCSISDKRNPSRAPNPPAVAGVGVAGVGSGVGEGVGSVVGSSASPEALIA